MERNHARLFLCWLLYRFWVLWPIGVWPWPFLPILAYVGEYAHSSTRADFFANAVRLRTTADGEVL